MNKSFQSYLLIALVALGCGQPPSSPPRMEQKTVLKAPDSAPDLAARLAALYPAEQRILEQRLADIDSGREQDGQDDQIDELVRLLCRLTLSQTNELGARLDAVYGGVATDFALVPVRRQQRALAAVQQIHKRMTEPEPGNYQVAPVITKERDLPWLGQRLNGKVIEVFSVSFTCDYADLGPQPTDISNEDMKLVAAFTGLRHLDLQISKVDDAGLSRLAHLTQLQFLDLSDCAITDDGLRHLAGMTQLKELKLVRTKVVGDGLKYLANCSNLSRLTVNEMSLTKAGAQSLNGFRALESLSIVGVSDLDLHDLPNLTAVSCDIAKSMDRNSSVRLRDLPMLKALHITTAGGAEPSLELRNLPAIVQLSCHDDLKFVPFEQIGKLTSLRELFINARDGDRTFSDSRLQELAELRQLTNLSLHGDIETSALRHFEKLTELQTLAIGGRDLEDVGLNSLRPLKKLQQLTINGIRGTGRGFEMLNELSSLRELWLHHTKLDSLHVDGHPKLYCIFGSPHQIRDVKVTHLPQLNNFYLGQLKTSTVEIGDLPSVRCVDLSLIQADKIQPIKLYGMPKLQRLWLTPITTDGGIENIPYAANINDTILANITTFPELESLSLRFAELTDAGLKPLYSLPKLTWVSINGPHVTPEAIEAIQMKINRK